MRKAVFAVPLLAALACLAEERDSAASSTAAEETSCIISNASVGKVALGMTVAAAKAALPEAVFSRTSDGEGVALIEVRLGDENLLVAYAGEEAADSPVDPNRRIEHIETFSGTCVTPDGVRPGMSVREAEKILGSVAAISRSEIESREFIQFSNHPAGLTIRLDNTGIFEDGSSETTRFAPEAKILSVAISSRG